MRSESCRHARRGERDARCRFEGAWAAHAVESRLGGVTSARGARPLTFSASGLVLLGLGPGTDGGLDNGHHRFHPAFVAIDLTQET